jgi:1,4-alpha-glucan branching enzyme
MAANNRERMVKVKFHPQTSCSEVKIAGDFTDWDKGAIMMSKSGRSGEWMTSVRVTPGEHQYRLIIDGNWYTDPNTEHITNPFGADNSILRVS